MTEANQFQGIKTPNLPLIALGIAIIFIIIVLGVRASILTEAETMVQQNKEEYSIEAKILKNQLLEKQAYSARIYDFNEWVAMHNIFLENHYNILLEYRDENMSILVKKQEVCLKTLYDYSSQNVEISLENELIDECNTYGFQIDSRLLYLIRQKIEKVGEWGA